MGRMHEALKKAEEERERKRRERASAPGPQAPVAPDEASEPRRRSDEPEEAPRRASSEAPGPRAAEPPARTVTAPVHADGETTGRRRGGSLLRGLARLERERRVEPPRHAVEGTMLVAHLDPTDFRAEQFRAIKTNIHALEPEPYLLGFTSALEDEGSPIVAANLACIFAEERSSEVLLIDANLRHPGLHRLLGIEEDRPGLADVLRGRLEPMEAVVPTSIPHVSLVRAGHGADNPGGLLASPRLRQALELWRERFDRVFVDTPAVLAVNDAAVVGKHLDGVSLVLKLASTPRDVCDQAMQSLRSARLRLCGCICTNADEPLTHQHDPED